MIIRCLIFLNLLLVFFKVNAQDALFVRPTGFKYSLDKAEFSPDGKFVLLTSEDGAYSNLWEVPSGKFIYSLNSTSPNVSFSPDGKYIIDWWEKVRVWKRFSGKLHYNLYQELNGGIKQIYSPDGKYFITISHDDNYGFKIWKISNGRLLSTINGFYNTIPSVVFSPNGKSLATSSSSGKVKIWDTSKGRLLDSLSLVYNGDTFNSQFRDVTYSSDGSYIIACLNHWTPSTSREHLDQALIGVWRLPNYEFLFSTKISSSKNAFSPDGKLIISTGYKTILWEVSNGKIIDTLEREAENVIFSPDGKYILTTTENNFNPLIYDAISGKLLYELVGHKSGILSCIFSQDGKYIVTASRDKTAKLWETNSGKLIYTMEGHQDYVNSAIFSPDGKYIVTSSKDGTAIVWETITGKIYHSLL